MKKLVWIALTATMLAACGGGDSGAGSCTQTSGSTQSCTDYGSGYTASSVMQACSGGSGTYSASACTSTNRVGRCTISSGAASYTQNYYSPTTASDVMTVCSAAGGTYAAN